MKALESHAKTLHSKRLVGSQFEAWAKELPRFAGL